MPMNPIQPVTTRPVEINVVEPVSPALERVKRVLFQPFDLGKWFVIGFCAWLACLGEGGGSGFHVPGGEAVVDMVAAAKTSGMSSSTPKTSS